MCDEGNYSDNLDFDATCSGGGGIDSWLAPYGECGDGHVIAMHEDADRDGHDGFKRLLPQDFIPVPEADDVALCANGTYSDNIDLAVTCSANGGVVRWLATFGECGDGHVIVMSGGASCSGNDGFAGLLPWTSSRHSALGTSPAATTACSRTTPISTRRVQPMAASLEWLATYGQCGDGTVIVMNDGDCGGHDGFATLMPVDYTPPTTTTTSTVPPTTAPPVTPTSAAPAEGPLALDVLLFIPVANERQGGYDRDRFNAWIDADGDGCDTRAEVLIGQSLTFAQVDPSGCGVVAGDWYSPYDG